MAVATSTLLGRPVWYELMTTDMKSAEAFYRTVIGWQAAPFEGTPFPYTAFNPTGGVSIAGVMTKPAEVKAPPFWAMYIAVPDLDEAVSKITGLGGKTHTEVIEIPNVGRCVSLRDDRQGLFFAMQPAHTSG